jgi:hypothetical protein
LREYPSVEVLRIRLAHLLEEIRKLHTLGLENSDKFKEKLKEARKLSDQLNETREVFNTNLSPYQKHLHARETK